jgi:hypothetical protein
MKKMRNVAIAGNRRHFDNDHDDNFDNDLDDNLGYGLDDNLDYDLEKFGECDASAKFGECDAIQRTGNFKNMDQMEDR